MIGHVKQKHAKGCGPACIAMITGYDYDYVIDFFSGIDFNATGIDFFKCNEFFVEHGYAINWQWPKHQAKGLNKPREVWPPKLWADVSLVCMLQHSGVTHYVVILKDGTIFDPLDGGEKTLADYKEVSQVIGVYGFI